MTVELELDESHFLLLACDWSDVTNAAFSLVSTKCKDVRNNYVSPGEHVFRHCLNNKQSSNEYCPVGLIPNTIRIPIRICE